MPQPPLAALADSIREFVGAVEAVGSSEDWEFLPNGPAARDWANEPMAGPWSNQPLQDAYRTGSVLWPVVADQALALADLLAPPGRPFAVMSVARSLAEAATRLWLLIEPLPPAAERVRRSMNDRLYAMFEERVLSADLPGVDLTWAEQNRDVIEATGTRHGWTVLPEDWDNYKASAFQPRRPSTQAALGELLDMPALAAKFCRTSASVAHASLHGVVKFLESSESSSTTQVRMRVADLTSGTAAMHMLPAVYAMSEVGCHYGRQAGWHAKPIFIEQQHLRLVWGAVLDAM
jgi:hypothetical protein